MKRSALLWLVCVVLALAGCDKATANVQTLISNDCGLSWSVVPAGQTIPKRMMACELKTTVPDYPMQGDTRFKTAFDKRVLADVTISYEYTIVDGVAFIKEAKYLGKMDTSSEDKSNSAALYETAENVVIDKRLREVATTLLLKEDIVNFSQAEFEDTLLEQTNEMLKQRGVRLAFISVVPIPEEQTRLAIDAITALQVYTRSVIELMTGDVLREGAGEFVDSREARQAIGRKAAELFHRKLKSALAGA